MKTVISASRRTDIPRWFLDDVITWFKEEGIARVKNPFNQQYYTVSLKKEDVHSIVWWSKDFGKYIEKHEFFDGFHQFFQFTINGYSDPGMQFLEPGMTTTLQDRLDQARKLAEIFGADKINWRFDPIVFWKDGSIIKDNLADYQKIAKAMASCGISTNTISFTQWYGKCIKRAKKRQFAFVEPTTLQRRSIARKLALIARDVGISVHACCNEDILIDGLIQKSSCIDGVLLTKLFGEAASQEHDGGQRETCGCTKSKDIGSYDMICKHGCVYCYANPKI
nr:DUF1848 family protein [Candidatus Sigynarchaeota archaeon]